MHSGKLIQIVSAHAEGEVGNVITGGVLPPPGETLWEMRDWLETDGTLRSIVLNEPRGGVFKHVNLLVPPRHPDAAAGFLIMEPAHTPPMSGSNAMCVATVLVGTGMIAAREPFVDFTLEVPAGLVAVRVYCEQGHARSVELQNVPSFADRLDAPLEVEGLPTLSVDTAFGGDSFVIVDAEKLGFAIAPDEGHDIATLGARITRAANEQIGFSHPEKEWNHISFTQFSGPLTREGDVLSGRNAVVIDPGKIDRSPCGTGASAKMATLRAKGHMAPRETYLARSIIGGEFNCGFQDIKLSTGQAAIAPRLRGRGWITGTHQIMVDPTDPWPGGYRVSDTWPSA